MNDFQKYLDENLDKIQIDSNDSEPGQQENYDIYQEIRDAVIALRRETHMTQKELAVKCGVTQANISNLEKGISKPTIDTLKKIADAFKMRLVIRFSKREVSEWHF